MDSGATRGPARSELWHVAFLRPIARAVGPVAAQTDAGSAYLLCAAGGAVPIAIQQGRAACGGRSCGAFSANAESESKRPGERDPAQFPAQPRYIAGTGRVERGR